MNNYDVAVVGGGVLGVFHAYHALQMGLKVALFERNSTPQGASVRNFGQVVPSGMNQKWQALGRKSLEVYQTIHAQMDIAIRQQGSVYVAADQEEMTLLEELAQINAHNGYPSQLLTAAECRHRYPGLREDYAVGGLFFPEELSVEPRITVPSILQFMVEQLDLAYFPNTQVHAIENTGNGCTVVAAKGARWKAQKVFVCGGHEFRTLYPNLFENSDLVAVKLQMLELRPQTTAQFNGNVLTGLSIRRYEAFSECPSWAEIKSRESQDSPEKRWGIHILLKQTPEGSIILGDSHEYADAAHADDLGFFVHEDINRLIIDRAKAIFQLDNWEVMRQWAGIYSQCKNSDIFQHAIDRNIQIITGIGGKGMTGSAGFAAMNIQQSL